LAFRPSPATVEDDPARIDPREAYSGPYRNIHPSVRYVGDKVCSSCHPDISSSYARHPMGRSLTPVRDLQPGERLTPANRHPFTAGNNRFEVVRRDGRVLHRRTMLDAMGAALLQQEVPVDYAIGSGSHGRSYLTTIDGFVFQTPVSWYSNKRIWDLSPGFEIDRVGGLRPVTADCLVCHSNRLKLEAGRRDRFQNGVFDGHAIGCERCHGPGETHLAERERGDALDEESPYSIVNPSRLPWPLRENVCEQCHLEGVTRIPRRNRGMQDFRPGLPLEKFLAVHTNRDGEDYKVVNHVEQMRLSRCFQKSAEENKLGCISCHNPHEHVGPERRATWYRGRCLQCHQGRGCKLHLGERWRLSPGDSCIDCHMPRFPATDVVHAAATDHRVMRRPRPPGKGGHDPASALENFYADRLPAGDPENDRDLGVALAHLLRMGHPRREAVGREAAELLRQAVEARPRDAEAWESLGISLLAAGQGEEAIAAHLTALELDSDRVGSLQGLASISEDEGSTATATGYLQRLVLLNPHFVLPRERLTELLLAQDDVSGAGEQAAHWLRLDPFSRQARRTHARILDRLGKRVEAAREADLARRMEMALPPR
jgi:hypothetical protein